MAKILRKSQGSIPKLNGFVGKNRRYVIIISKMLKKEFLIFILFKKFFKEGNPSATMLVFKGPSD